jgi:LysM repeat protein
MNNRPPISSSPSSSIASFRKRKQRGNPNIIYIIAGLLVLGGVILLIAWLASPGRLIGKLLATDTPTPTVTYTPTSTMTPTATSTETPTSTITATATLTKPFSYSVQPGDSLFSLSAKYELGKDGIQFLMLANPYRGLDKAKGLPDGIDPLTQTILPGQVILIPDPAKMSIPTATLVPAGLPKGKKETYIVQSGDSLAKIAALFNSTTEDIIKENNIKDANAIQVGQQLIIPVNMVTPTATRPPTSTAVPPGPGTVLPTASLTPIN